MHTHLNEIQIEMVPSPQITWQSIENKQRTAKNIYKTLCKSYCQSFSYKQSGKNMYI